MYLGAVTYYYVRVADDVRLAVMEQNQAPPPHGGYAVGDAVHAVWDAQSGLLLPAR